jgi:quercetin dioxygenase-like cupin family protein
MGDSSVQKVESSHSPVGEMGQKYLAIGLAISMRLWENVPPGERKPARPRPYETVGYVISGSAELHLEGQVIVLKQGDSWIVPNGAVHSYNILETFTAVEATTPPASVHDRDADSEGR